MTPLEVGRPATGEWPEALQTLFPADPQRGVFRRRPWWQMLTPSARSLAPAPRLGAVRTDGEIVELEPGTLTPPTWETLAARRHEVERCIEQHDRRFPLPFPGVRPGQLWAWLDEEGDRPVSTLMVLRRARDTGPTKLWHTDRTALYGTTEDLTEGTLSGCFLVADVACPHLAPWAPPESP